MLRSRFVRLSLMPQGVEHWDMQREIMLALLCAPL